MPTITINGVKCQFTPGQMILQVAQANGIDIPSYCYHDGLSIVASCRICLGEAQVPNPKNDNKLEPFMGGKLFPTCQTPATDGMVVQTDSPKAIANQKAVMEYLLINHPLDCPVCDQAGSACCRTTRISTGGARAASRRRRSRTRRRTWVPMSCSIPTGASCARVACGSPARSAARPSSMWTGAATRTRSMSSRAWPWTTRSPAT
ncbi:MAG: (2Fe-2S)-binding protein [Phycisphaerales bacterium]|nr:(2Fe-2S)-binding protein [Phycisphaerales bacterium]